MNPVLWWRVFVAAAVIALAAYVVHLIKANATMSDTIDAQAKSIGALQMRAAAIERAQEANNAFATTNQTQASRGIARNETARRSDSDVIAIDKPWPAAVRGRVFDNPDPTSGSTEPATVPAAGAGGRDQVPQP